MAKLPYKVECKSTRPYFEVIAAFDCEHAAVGYAGECALSAPNRYYLVKKGRKVLKEFGPEKAS